MSPDWAAMAAARLSSGEKGRAELRAEARAARQNAFGNRVFIRGVVEVSNFCRENCSYCGMRRDNRDLRRFRVGLDSLLDHLLSRRPASVTDINIQAGEDPVAVREIVVPLVKAIRRETSLGVSVCLGTLPPALYAELRDAGASTYIIKFEIADPALFKSLNAPGEFAERLDHIRLLAKTGWNVSSGFIAGLPGQSDTSFLQNFALAASLPLDGCSVSPFIPGEATPLKDAPVADLALTLDSMAMLRLIEPSWIIPAVSALGLAGPDSGYEHGFAVGANLATINLTPPEIRGDYLLYKRNRVIISEDRILAALEAQGLEPSNQSMTDHFSHRKAAAA